MVERIELGLEMAEQIRSHEVVRDHLIGWGSWVHRFLRLGVTFLRPSSPLVYAPHAVDHDEDNDSDDDDDYDGGDDDDGDGDDVVGAERKARVARRDKNLGRIPDPISPINDRSSRRENLVGDLGNLVSRVASRFSNIRASQSLQFNNLDYLQRSLCTRPNMVSPTTKYTV